MRQGKKSLKKAKTIKRTLSKRVKRKGEKISPFVLVKPQENPIIEPKAENGWEAWQTFNPGVILLNDKVHFLYRAIGQDGISRLGYAASSDGFSIDERLPYPVYPVRGEYALRALAASNGVYEHRVTHSTNSGQARREFRIYSYFSGGSWGGAEDPRIVQVNDEDILYMTYTACDNGLRVALTSIKVQDFSSKKWKWAKPVIISPPDFDDKDALIFQEKLDGKYVFIHRVGGDIDFTTRPTLNFKDGDWLEEYRWLFPRKGWWDSKKVGAAAPPIKTKEGWVMLYHGVSEDGVYRVGAVLLDAKNPLKVIGRTDNPIFEPEASYEKEGQVRNVVFPCGAVLLGHTLFVYYGGGDQVVGVATVNIDKLLLVLKLCKC